MIRRYECLECGWYADISDDKDEAHFSTTICNKCGGKLTEVRGA